MAARNMLVALTLAAGTAVVVRVRQAAREAASTPAGVTAAVDALIARHWTWRMRNNPELAAFFGVDPGSGAAALDDRSVAAYEALGRHATAMLAELAALPDTPLPAAGECRTVLPRSWCVWAGVGVAWVLVEWPRCNRVLWVRGGCVGWAGARCCGGAACVQLRAQL